MKITFILPAVGKKADTSYSKTWKMEPLTFAMLKALTPANIETVFYDDRIEKVNLEEESDLVAISVESYTAKRAYFFADQFRSRGLTVILGGYHTTLAPDEALEHADSILCGNAEGVWETMINDFSIGELKKKYTGETGFSGKMPDRSIYRDKSYLPVKLIETGRGCPHSCGFCSISNFYDASYHHRPISEIIEEIKAVKARNIFFVDDNLTADKGFALKLFKEMAKLKVSWSGQTTLSIARDRELLYWMRKSGCDLILIGFESLNSENLKQMGKEWNEKLGERDELVNEIHKAGLNIYATFIFGFDEDDQSMAKEVLAFAKKHAFIMSAFNHVLPFPGTPFYSELETENRFIFDKWWLNDEYSFGLIPFKTKKVDAYALSGECFKARKEFYTIFSILRRSYKVMIRTKSPWKGLKFLIINFLMKEEGKQRYGMKLGYGLEK